MSTKVIRNLQVMLLDVDLHNIAITCRCGCRWVENDVPKLMDTMPLVVVVFNCPRCGTPYGNHQGVLRRINPDGSPSADSSLAKLPSKPVNDWTN